MEKKSETRMKIVDMFLAMPGRQYGHALVGKIGHKYIHFVSMYEGSKPMKVSIDSFLASGSLYENATRE